MNPDDLMDEIYGPAPAQTSVPEEAPQPRAKYASAAARAFDAFEQQRAQDSEDQLRKEEILRYQAEHAKDPGISTEVGRYAAVLPHAPLDVIERNLVAIRPIARARQLDFKRIAEDHPVLAGLIGDPTTAGQAIDDAGTLGTLEQIIGKWGQADFASVKRDATTGEAVASKNVRAFGLITPPAWMAAARDAFSKDLPYMGAQFEELTQGIFPWSSRFDPPEVRREKLARLAEGTTGAKDYLGPDVQGAKRLITGAFLSPFKNAPMLMGNILASAAGMAVGGPAGSAAAMFMFNSAYSAPGMYGALSEMTDASGKKIDDNYARIATAIGAPLVGRIMSKGLGPTFNGYAQRALEDAGTQTIKKALAEDTMLRQFGRWAAQSGIHVGEGAATFAMQAGMEASVEQLTRSFALGERADTRPVGAAMWEGFKQGLVDMPVLASWASGRDLLHAVGQAKRAQESYQRNLIMKDAVEAAKHPEIAEQLAEKTAAQPGAATHSYIDLQAFQDHALKNKLDPREVAEALFEDKGAAYDQAIEQHAADLAIPIDKAQRLIKNKVFGDFWTQENRYHPDDPSYSRITRDLTELDKLQTEAFENKGVREPEHQAIYDDAFAKAKGALEAVLGLKGRAEELADAHARMTLATVLGFQARSGSSTSAEWYQRTFKELRIFGGGQLDPNVAKAAGVSADTVEGAYFPISKEIRLFDTVTSARSATLPHEFMHATVDVLEKLSAGHPELAKDYETLIKSAGYADAAERAVKRDPAKEEKITHQFELYLAEGKAPSSELTRAFDRIRSWQAEAGRDAEFIGGRYRTLYQEGKGEPLALSPEAHDVFSRLLANQEEVARAQKTAKLMEQLKAAVEKMDDKEKEAYFSLGVDSTMSAQELLAKWIAENGRRENKRLMKEAREGFAVKAEEELDRDPVQRALLFLQTGELRTKDPRKQAMADLLRDEDGPFKLSEKEIVQQFGAAFTEQLKAQHRGIFGKQGNTAPADTLARVFMGPDGTAEQLVHGLAGAPPRAEALRRETQRRMTEKFGPDLVDHPEALADAAVEAAHNETAARRMLIEMRALGRDLDPTRQLRANLLKPEKYEALAAQLMAKKTLREINPHTFVRGEERAFEKAVELANKGDMARAWDALEGRMLNFYLYRQAREIEKKLKASFERLIDKATSDSYRTALGKADPAYRDAHDSILSALGLREGEAKPGAWDVFRKAAQDHGQPVSQFDDIAIRDVLTGQRGWKDLHPDEAKSVLEAVHSIKYLAKDLLEAKVGERKVELDTLKAAIRDHLEPLPVIDGPAADKTQEGVGRKIFRAFQARDANLAEPRVWLGFLGPDAKRAVWDEFVGARNHREQLMKSIHEKFAERWQAYQGKEDRYDPIPELADRFSGDGFVGPRSKLWLMMVMHWMGDEGARKRVLKHLNATPDEILALAGKYLTRDDLAWVQSNHDLMEKELWPLEAAKHERRTGLPLEKTKAMPYEVTFADGSTEKYAGGYFPVKYDPRASQMSMAMGAQQAEAGGPPRGLSPATSKTYTKTRSENYTDVPNLQWEVYPAHLVQVIHDLAFDEYVHESSKILLSKEMNQLIYAKLGEQYALQPRAWLEAVARDAADSTPEHLRELGKAQQYARGALLYGALGYNASVVAADILHPIASALMREGGWYTVTKAVPAMFEMLRPGAVAEVTAKATELQHRQGNAFMHYKQEFGEVGAAGAAHGIFKARNTIKHFAFYMMEQVDKLTSAMIWKAKYNDVFPTHGEEAAVTAANEAVQASMPTHALTEMPGLLRDKRGVGAMLVFYGYYSKLYNLAREQGHEMIYRAGAENGAGDAAWGAAKWAGRVMGMMIVTNVWGDYLMGHGKDQDETWGEWYARKTLASPFSMIPYASGAAQLAADELITGKAKQINPLRAPAFALVTQAYDTIGKVASDKRSSDQKLWDLIEMALMTAQLPSRQIRRTGSYLAALAEGTESPSNPADFAGKLVYGSKKHKEANPGTTISDLVEGK